MCIVLCSLFVGFQSWPEGIGLEAFEDDKKLNIYPMAVVLAVYVHIQSSNSPASRYHGNSYSDLVGKWPFKRNHCIIVVYVHYKAWDYSCGLIY